LSPVASRPSECASRLPGARRYRQILSTDAVKVGAGPEVIAAAFAAVDFEGARETVSA